MSGTSRCPACEHPRGPQKGCAGLPSCQTNHRHTNKPNCHCPCHAAKAVAP